MQLSANDHAKKLSKQALISWDWTAGLLLLLAVYISGLRLAATQWTENLRSVQFIGFLALLAGLTLGRSRFSGLAASLLATLYASFFIPYQLGLLILDAPDWNERLRSLGGRILFSLNQLFDHQNVSDPILFLAMMAPLFWGLCCFAGYRLARHNDPWGATLPMGIALVGIQTYDFTEPRRVWFLGAYMLCTLLLVSRVQLVKQQTNWKRLRTHMPMYLGADMLRYATGIGFLLVVLAWVTPALASPVSSAESLWDVLTRPWRAIREDFGRAFYPLEGNTPTASDYYGQTLALGRGNAQSGNIVFTVEVMETERRPARFYWRDRVYDLYENGEWQISFDQTTNILPNEDELIFPQMDGRAVGRFRFTTGKSIFLLHTAPQPLWVSRIANVSFAPNFDGSLDLAAWRAPSGLEGGESYEAEGWLSAASIQQLRAAGTEYPGWVTKRYLQIPDEISQRTRELAAQIAEGLDNPYDIATAVTSYLRANIEYQENVPLPPSGAEPVDWVLFEQPQGFCNYYATAQVMLLRILGIPSRLAVGYSQGEETDHNLLLESEFLGEQILEERVLGNVYYTVRQRDAHAWPEVFFPNIGWVEFEPTANQEELMRPLTDDALPEEESLAEGTETEEPAIAIEESTLEETLIAQQESNALQRRAVQTAALGLGIVVFFVALLWRRHRRRGGAPMVKLIESGFARLDIKAPRVITQWAFLAELSPLARAYMQINISLARLGVAPKRGHTPNQRATALGRQLPELRQELVRLSREYQANLYGKSDSGSVTQTLSLTWRLRAATLLAVIRRNLDVLRDWQRKYNPLSRP